MKEVLCIETPDPTMLRGKPYTGPVPQKDESYILLQIVETEDRETFYILAGISEIAWHSRFFADITDITNSINDALKAPVTRKYQQRKAEPFHVDLYKTPVLWPAI
jgi:hypothetical protein